jgi:RNA-directed DNA polymerase
MTKQYEIPKHLIWEAYQQVKKNAGAAGVDSQSIKGFEENLKGNLYKIWNRLSSGSYFPPPVRAVEIPKQDGSSRLLGIPTVSDRIAQSVVKSIIEPRLETVFHHDSYGYRPGRSAHDAIEKARERCWKHDVVIDLDIKGFFDNLDHQLVMKATRKHVSEPWVLDCIERWLVAPLQKADGSQMPRNKGTPQGGVISPLLANLFLHYAFDLWMQREFPDMVFERYADDIIVHCNTDRQAEYILSCISSRMRACNLELHPTKTRIVRIRDKRKGARSTKGTFDFLGFTFKPRIAKTTSGRVFSSVLPGISQKAAIKIRSEIRSWKLHIRSGTSLDELANFVNPKVQGWIQYYGKFYKTALYAVLQQLERQLNSWARRKFKSLKRSKTKAGRFLGRVATKRPGLFVHWMFGVRSSAGMARAV